MEITDDDNLLLYNQLKRYSFAEKFIAKLVIQLAR